MGAQMKRGQCLEPAELFGVEARHLPQPFGQRRLGTLRPRLQNRGETFSRNGIIQYSQDGDEHIAIHFVHRVPLRSRRVAE